MEFAQQVESRGLAEESIDEKELVERARRRDPDAFAQLYESHLPRIYRYVYYRVRSEAEAEDIAEQVFLRAWETIERYEQRGAPFAAWLYRLAHNLVVDHYRGHRPSVSLDDIGDTPESGIDVSELVEIALDVAEVRAALALLNTEHQQVLILRFIEGLSHAQVAIVIGKSEGATRVVQHRALAALARVLQRSGKEL